MKLSRFFLLLCQVVFLINFKYIPQKYLLDQESTGEAIAKLNFMLTKQWKGTRHVLQNSSVNNWFHSKSEQAQTDAARSQQTGMYSEMDSFSCGQTTKHS